MKKSSFFWVGYADLMTSLFFIMLVLYIVSFALYSTEREKMQGVVEKLEAKTKEAEENLRRKESMQDSLVILAEKARIIESVEENLQPLKNNGDLFVYDSEFKRFNLAFDVQFEYGKSKIVAENIKNDNTINELETVGHALVTLIEKLRIQKLSSDRYKDISYLIVVSGSASDYGEEEFKNYSKSYERAYYLYEFWKTKGIDLDAKKYHHLVEFQISGNGTGGVGRFIDEGKNQRFIINIIPKIGEVL